MSFLYLTRLRSDLFFLSTAFRTRISASDGHWQVEAVHVQSFSFGTSSSGVDHTCWAAVALSSRRAFLWTKPYRQQHAVVITVRPTSWYHSDPRERGVGDRYHFAARRLLQPSLLLNGLLVTMVLRRKPASRTLVRVGRVGTAVCINSHSNGRVRTIDFDFPSFPVPLAILHRCATGQRVGCHREE